MNLLAGFFATGADDGFGHLFIASTSTELAQDLVLMPCRRQYSLMTSYASRVTSIFLLSTRRLYVPLGFAFKSARNRNRDGRRAYDMRQAGGVDLIFELAVRKSFVL